MADDQSQRPYRSSESIARAGQGKPAASGSDPLAELARLIGQSDPFGEFSRENARRAGGTPPRAEPPAYAAPPAAPVAAPKPPQQDYYAAPSLQAPTYAPQDYTQPAPVEPAYAQPGYAQPAYGQQTYAQQGYTAAEAGASAYAAQPAGAAGYEHADHQYPGNPPYNAEEQDFYDDVPPSRRRTGVLVIAGVFALAILGTAGAFGYRALFGSSSSGSPPPVIKAETAPSKIVPATAKDAQSNKLITDRVTGPQGEKLVSREETPVSRPPLSPDNSAGNATGGTQSAPLGSGVVAGEPKKIRTIAIHPDQNPLAEGPSIAAPQRAGNGLPPVEPPVRQVQTRPVPPPQAAAPVAAAPAPAANAPLSLNPNAQAARASAPARTASVAPSSGGTAYAVQVTSQRSEAEAQAAFRSLQGKYAAQLGGKPSFIHRVDLGAKGTYYRAMVGPYGNQNEASELCASLKAAGGQCIIQKN
jgi:hypothetical protein